MIEVVCVSVGDKYPIEYVKNLHNAVNKFLTVPFRFSCITDKPMRDINCIPAPTDLVGWWVKPYIFSKDNGLEGTIFYLDLDQIIIGDLNKFVSLIEPQKLFMVKDFSRTELGNSSVMLFNKDDYTHIWDNFSEDKINTYKGYGDQGYIYYENLDTVAFFPKNWVKSWKWEVLNGGVANGYMERPVYRNREPDLSETSILCFHGEPKPEQIPSLSAAWECKTYRHEELWNYE